METLDLHGVKHEDVGRMLDKFFWENMQKNIGCVKIITGKSDEMKKIVNEVMIEYGFPCEEDWFNCGILNVTLL